MIIYWDNKPGGITCVTCEPFVGHYWADSDVPIPPLHPNCECFWTPAENQIPQTSLGPISDESRRALIRLVAHYLLTTTSIPPTLEFLMPEAEEYIRNRTTAERLTPVQFSAEGALTAVLVEPGRTRTITNGPGRHEFTAQALDDAFSRGLFRGIACHVDHAFFHPSVRDLLGVWTDAAIDNGRITATLRPYDTDANRPIIQLLEQIRQTPADQRPDVGISLVLYADPTDDGRIEHIAHIESADLVVFPAVPAARFQFSGDTPMQNLTQTAGASAAPAPDPAWDAEYRRVQAAAIIDLTELPPLVKTRLKASTYPTPEALNSAIDSAREELAALHNDGVINLPGRPRIQVRDPLEEAADITQFLFGVEGVNVPANLRNVSEWYRALTGDVQFRGTFDPARIQFAGANTSTLANLAVNAMNKVIVQQMSNLDAWRWYERITSVEPNDGSLHPMKWITIGGISNLPQVAEGASYTEVTVDDVSEADSFTKYGGYVGITREMLKNSDIARLQAIPRALATAAIRSRSAAVSYLFTQASGVGPTLEQDSTALFHANHTNVATTALGTDATAWRAARAECFQHVDVNSGKVLGVFPRFLLVPAELYDVALAILGYGEGMPTTYTPEAVSRGFADPRPIPLVVPDWTDATDWAYIVDPAVYPVIQMSYSQNPGGRSHPAPELFAVTGETNGLLFTNDTLPIKVRDEFAVGVNGPRGIGKRNVAG